MKIALALAIMNLVSVKGGIAENQHYINYIDGTGYYIEEDIGITRGDVIVDINGHIFVIEQLEISR